MIAFKGRLSFRQYMPAKPTKYGIKVWMATDSDNGYVANFSVYLGSEGNGLVQTASAMMLSLAWLVHFCTNTDIF